MNIERLSQKTKEIISTTTGKSFSLLGLTILLVIFFVYFAIRPSLVKIAEIQREVTDNNEYLIKLDEKIKNLDAVAQQLDDPVISPKLKFFSEALPHRNDINELLLNLSSLASKNGLTVTNISNEYDLNLTEKELGISNQLAKYKMQLNFEGDPNGFSRFLESLAFYPRAISISNVGITKGLDGKFQYRFDIVAYFINSN